MRFSRAAGTGALIAGLSLATVASGETDAPPADAATALRATTDCDADGSRQPTAHLTWTAAPTAGEQRVALTPAADGFETGRLETSDTLPAGTTTFDWRPLHARVTHYWRVLTRHGDAWVPSTTAKFPAPACAAERLVIPPVLPPGGAARDGTESPIPKGPTW